MVLLSTRRRGFYLCRRFWSTAWPCGCWQRRSAGRTLVRRSGCSLPAPSGVRGAPARVTSRRPRR